MSAGFEIVAQGDVFTSAVGTAASIATAGPRVAVDRHGRVVCTFMSQTKLGLNDFVPMICRSDNNGDTWEAPVAIWPVLAERYSIFCNLSRSPAGDMFLFGSRTPIHERGEPFFSPATTGLKANELIWARSRDDGRTWSSPSAFPLPYPGAAEAPAPLLVTRQGRWIAPYSPYNLFDGSVAVDRAKVITVASDDQGATWKPGVMIRFEEPESCGAEAWVIQLSDGRLLGTTWHVDVSGRSVAYPNLYAISSDNGDTWSPTRSTGITANTTALMPLSDRRALFITVRRRSDAGIWLSVVEPATENFGVLADERAWSCATATQSGGEASHDSWTDFSFGEPSVAPLADGSLLMVFWYVDQRNAGVRYIRFRMVD